MKPQHNAEPGLCSSSPALCPVPTKPWHFLSFHLLVFVTWGPQSSDRNRSADPHPPRVGQRASADTPLGPVFQTQRGDSISPRVHVGSLANLQCEFWCCQLHRGWPFSSFSTNV